MEKESKIYDKLWKYKWLWAVAWWLIIVLLSYDTDIKKDNNLPKPKKEIVPIQVKIIENPKDTIDFSQCNSVDDMIKILKAKNHIATISPRDYFNKNKDFFTQANVLLEDFISYYEISDIIKYGVYTDKYTHNYYDRYLEILNNIILSQSNYTEYIDKPNEIITLWLHGSLRNIYPNIDEKSPKKEYPKYRDIAQWVYEDDNKYPRWVVKDTLDKYNVFLKSSELWFKEIGNNYTGNRTCIHWFKKKTLSCITDLAIDIQKRFWTELCKKYKIITISWWTEKDSHTDNPYHDDDHPWWSKFDLTVTKKRWILLWMYLWGYGILIFQSWTELKPIKKDILWHTLKVIPHSAHFDISVE